MPTTTLESQIIKKDQRPTRLLKNKINGLLENFGYRFTKIRPIPPEEHIVRRRKLLETHGINLIFDVGANIGQYGKRMRNKVGYSGRIVSFEPMSKEFQTLRKIAENDPLWEVENIALGQEAGKGEIKISGNSVSSSLLDMLPSVVEACTEEAAYVGTEEIIIEQLDTVFGKYCRANDNVMLKIDTQGSEKAVLEGALNSLPGIKGLELEISFIRFYKGDVLFDEMIDYVGSLGFNLMSIEPGLNDIKTGRQLQSDALFFRE